MRVRMYVLYPDLVDAIYRRTQARDSMAVERAGLKPRRIRFRLGLAVGLHPRAADPKGADFYPLCYAQAARALRAHQPLVPRKAQHIYAHFPHVDRETSRRLRCVDDKRYAMFMRKRAYAGNIQHITRKVGCMRANDCPRVWPYQPLKVRIINPAALIQRNEAKLYVAFCLKAIQRTQHGIVFQVGGYNVVSRADDPCIA